MRNLKLRFIWTTLILALLLLTLASPVLLALVGRLYGADWIRISNIGQAYGFASAALSGLALLAVAYTVLLQQRELRAERFEAHRPIHMDLLKMAIADETLMDCLDVPRTTPESGRQHVYLNLFFSWWQHNYCVSDTITEAELYTEAHGMFSREPGRLYWERVRSPRTEIYKGKREREFLSIVERAYRDSEPIGAAENII